MALTALEIFKLLPKTNCGKCGVPTCLAFAMRLANKQTELSACPDVSDAAKAQLEASSQPPMRLVKIGTGDNIVEIGSETEMFRHEKTFYHQTGYCVLINDSMSNEEIEKKVKEANNVNFEKVGQILKLNLIAVKSENGAEQFASAVETVQNKTELPLILISDKPEIIEAGLKISSENVPLIHAANSGNFKEMANLAKNYKCPLTVYDETLDELAELTKNVKAEGVEDIILDFGKKSLIKTLENLTVLRRLALKKNFRPLGYPVITFLDGDEQEQAIMGTICTLKYSSITVFNNIETWMMLPLLTLRMNIFTDPQRPLQVKQDIYEINNPDENSPLLVTSNFSLTYSIVSGDIDRSKKPAHLLVLNTEGLSVMTAFAADKLNASLITKALEDEKAEELVNHKNLIIPGQTARISGKLAEESGWKIFVGPRDSSGLPKYLREM